MNWTIVEIDGKWHVVDAAGATVGDPHTDKAEAVGALRDLVDLALQQLQDVPTDQMPTQGARFRATFEEGDISVDGRVIDENATNFERPTPLPWMLLTENEDGPPHTGARLSGVVDSATREGTTIVLEGRFDSGSEAGIENERLVREGVLTTWSPDFGNTQVDIEVVPVQENPAGEEELQDGGIPIDDTDFLLHLVSGSILGGTSVPFPALTSARVESVTAAASRVRGTIEILGEETVEAPSTEAAPAQVTPITAAVRPPLRPPAEWFQDHGFTPEETGYVQITDEGRIYGYVAPWEVCHIGYQDVCVTAPHSESDYAYYMMGDTELEDGSLIRSGVITLGTGHADLHLSAREAISHYDNTATAVADVVVGENEHGVWHSGALRPGVTEDQIRTLRAAKLSGDWRPFGGSDLELVAALAVNTAGFPMPRARVASGRIRALVAAGGPDMAAILREAETGEYRHLRQSMGRFERIAPQLERLARKEMREEVHR